MATIININKKGKIKMSIKIKKRYEKQEKVLAPISGESKTKQSFKDQVDINKILNKYNKTGQLPDLIKQNPQYGDFSTVTDYQESLNKVLFAQEQFNSLPARVRLKFNNNPSEFLEFAINPANLSEMEKLGLTKDTMSNKGIQPISELLGDGSAGTPGVAGKIPDSGTESSTNNKK